MGRCQYTRCLHDYELDNAYRQGNQAISNRF
jgi:hypothetical protein